VLDEPTNDLDLDTLRALEEFLDEWPGALVVASHDRTFLDRTVDHVLAIDSAGSVARVPGGVQGWLDSRRVAPGAAPKPVPKRRPAPERASATSSRYTLGRQLRDTEQALTKAQRSVDELHEQLDAAAASGHERLAALGSELAEAQSALSDLEERWLELAERQSG
jgi:ATP-binding cassette subfamily F protein uup